MPKTDTSLRNITLAAIRRAAKQGATWRWTKFYETEKIIDIGAFHVECSFSEEELPVASTIETAENWVIVTTRRIVGKHQGIKQEVAIREIAKWHWGDFKGIGKKPFTTIHLETQAGSKHTFKIETGAASMVMIYAIRT